MNHGSFVHDGCSNMADMEDEDGNELLNDYGWEVVPVDVEAYRRMGDPAFKLHFRMTKTTFEELLHTVGNFMVDNLLLIRERTPLDLMLLHTIWILATPDSFRSVALRFGVSPSTIHAHYLRIICALCELAPRFITWPSQEERQEIKTAFLDYSGFPGIVGCVDGTYIVMSAPTIQPRRFINRHQYSFNIQVTCDHKLLARDVYIGEAGAINDARVFRRSPLCRRLLTDPTAIEPDEHLVGDGIYMLTDKLLTPFRNNGHLLPDQRVYNYRLCKCRTRVEHFFGKFFSQWRRLKFLHSFDIEYAAKTVTACLVLHNFMILGGHELVEDIPDQHVEGDEYVEDDIFSDYPDNALDHIPPHVINRIPFLRMLNEARLAGTQKREHIVAFLQGH